MDDKFVLYVLNTKLKSISGFDSKENIACNTENVKSEQTQWMGFSLIDSEFAGIEKKNHMHLPSFVKLCNISP